jgi:hypothetical protein
MRVRGAVEAQQRQVDLMNKLQVQDFISFNVADPDPGCDAFFTPEFGMGKNQNQYPGSGMNIPDHIFEGLESILFLTILKFFDPDPGSGMFLTLDPGSGMEKLRSGMFIPDAQHCFFLL